MTLPPRALQVLATIKKELLSVEAPLIEEEAKPKKQKEPRRVMRHARPPNAFQRSCQRRDFSSPIY